LGGEPEIIGGKESYLVTMVKGENRANIKDILIIAPNFKPTVGGVSEYVHQMALSLDRIGQNVTVFNSSFKAKGFNPGYKVVDNRISTSLRLRWVAIIVRRIKYIFQLFSIITGGQPDFVILSRFSRTAIIDMIVARLLLRPFILFIHGREIFVKKGWLQTALMKAAQWGAVLIVVNSDYTKRLAKKYCSQRKKIEILLPGVNLEDFEITDQIACAVDSIRSRYENKKIVLFCGRLVVKKGLANLIWGFQKVVAFDDRARLVVMGSGPEEEKARLLVEKCGISKYVEFVGLLEGETKIAYFHACDLFVLPSINTKDDIESFGIVCLEAAACRKPVVAGNSGGGFRNLFFTEEQGSLWTQRA